MTTMNISLPDDMKAWVDAQVQARGFMSASEFIRDLIRRQKEETEESREKPLERSNSGPGVPAEEFFAQPDQRVANCDR